MYVCVHYTGTCTSTYINPITVLPVASLFNFEEGGLFFL